MTITRSLRPATTWVAAALVCFGPISSAGAQEPYPGLDAYIAKAVDEKADEDDLIKMLDEMLDETGGAPTPAETRDAEKVLGIKPRRRPRRK